MRASSGGKKTGSELRSKGDIQGVITAREINDDWGSTEEGKAMSAFESADHERHQLFRAQFLGTKLKEALGLTNN